MGDNAQPLLVSSTSAVQRLFRVVVDIEEFATTTSGMLDSGLCLLCVVDFGLESVIIQMYS